MIWIILIIRNDLICLMVAGLQRKRCGHLWALLNRTESARPTAMTPVCSDCRKLSSSRSASRALARSAWEYRPLRTQDLIRLDWQPSLHCQLDFEALSVLHWEALEEGLDGLATQLVASLQAATPRASLLPLSWGRCILAAYFRSGQQQSFRALPVIFPLLLLVLAAITTQYSAFLRTWARDGHLPLLEFLKKTRARGNFSFGHFGCQEAWNRSYLQRLEPYACDWNGSSRA